MLSSIFSASPAADGLFSRSKDLPSPVKNVYAKTKKKGAKKGEITVDEKSGNRIVKGGKKRMREEMKKREAEKEGSYGESGSGSDGSGSDCSGSDGSGDGGNDDANNSITNTPQIDDENDGTELATTKGDSERTIFVGNLPPNYTTKLLKALFSRIGAVESCRLRSNPNPDEKVQLPPHMMAKSVGAVKAQNTVKRVSANMRAKENKKSENTDGVGFNGYVVFRDVSSVEKSIKEMNGKEILPGRKLRVDNAESSHNHLLSVFVGNLPYATTEDALRLHFEAATGSDSVTSVHVIRDKETGNCKGIAYVAFTERSLVIDALRLGKTTFMKREIRVEPCGKLTKGQRGAGGKKKRWREDPNLPTSRDPKTPDVENGAMRRMKVKVKGLQPEKRDKSTTKDSKKDSKKDSTKVASAKVRGPKSEKGKMGSQRKAKEKKVVARIKKIEKRIKKGMGKNRAK